MKDLVVLGILTAILTVTLSSTSGAARSTTAATLTAVVNVDGSLARGRGAVSSSQLGVDGQYEVVFNRDVSNCAYVVSGGEATTLPPDDAVVFTVAPRDGNPNAVFVQEWDGVLGRDSYSSGFHLMVVC
jgi:hypothetical protein